ncbi:MAG: hypothetical protein ACXVCP_19120 [Bdellovibrio sp.]
MKNLIKIIILAVTFNFANNANAEISAKVNCQYKTQLYANAKLPFVALPPMAGHVLMQDDTFIMIEFNSSEFAINDNYSLILEPSYMKSGAIPDKPDFAWNPNGGELYLKAMLVKTQNNSKTDVGYNWTSSNVVSSPKELEELKQAQATKTHPLALSIENTEYHTLELNHTLEEMVKMRDQIKDMITRVDVKCQYSQVNTNP